ncbi:MAG: preprotein translocase subunit SecG [Methylacidiphilales bacterium]|nr:preprotein translocase subunit SecG [Candidatus Methylacidiphilales bacterium]
MSKFWTDIAINTLLFFYVIVALFMCLVVLMQRSKQEGLGAAFGGGFTDSVWGAQTSQVLVKTTVWLAVLFFVLSIALARLYSHREALTGRASTLEQDLLKPVSAIVTNAAPVAAAPPASTSTAPATATPASSAAPAAPAAVAPAASTSTTPATATPASNAAPAAPANPAAK